MSDTQGPRRPAGFRKIELNGYQVPAGEPISPEQERELGRTIQVGNAALARLVDQLTPALKATLESADTFPLNRQDLLELALSAARHAVERHARSPDPDGELVECAAINIRHAVAEYIDGSDHRRWNCGGDGARWASDHLGRTVFENHAGALSGIDPDLLADLCARARAIDVLVRAHGRLVASRLAARRGRGQDDPDLLQRGMLALMRAAESFDPDRHPRFNALARAAIANEFENARREESGTTASGCRLLGQFRKAEIRLASQLGRSPNTREVLDNLGWSNTRRRTYQQASAASTAARIGDTPLAAPTVEPLQELVDREDVKRFDTVWNTLGELGQEILVARYWADRRETLEELSERLGLTLHRVRRIERESLEKLGGLPKGGGHPRPPE